MVRFLIIFYLNSYFYKSLNHFNNINILLLLLLTFSLIKTHFLEIFLGIFGHCAYSCHVKKRIIAYLVLVDIGLS